MRFDKASSVEEVVWDMRLSDEPRAADRAVLLKTFNGNPPFDPSTTEENNIQINVNDLSGPNLLAMARRQWNNAFLKPSQFFVARPDYGPAHKKDEWSIVFTREINRLLKRCRKMIAQIRATGANVMLYGIGPVNWKDKWAVMPNPIPVSSLMIPSETEIDDFDNLSYFAIFREWTPVQLWQHTHGPKVDPGWNMRLVEAQMDYLRDQLRKSPNSLAYQYMPERIEELIKQDKGYFGSDAVPTCDVWDFYFREAEDDGKGWYRRVILDWGAGEDLTSFRQNKTRPTSRNKVGDSSEFLYSSGKRKYADSLCDIIHCQFGDCSPYAPFRYHSIRSLAWMLWGVCDLQNRLHCKFNEAVFEQCMWFFQTAGNADLVRLKKANFEHMGVIPQGIKFLTPQERYTPNYNLIQMAFARNRQLMSDSATTYTQEYDQGPTQQGRTATETMAIVNSTQALGSSIIELGYTYETFKYREMVRRALLKNSKDPIAREFRLQCLKGGIPEEMLDVDKWDIQPSRVIGAGNKTLQMASVSFLNSIRPNLPPEGQRLVDHISVEAATEQPDMANEMAPLDEYVPISNSMSKAQDATIRLLRGLPYEPPKGAILEDFVKVWLQDLAVELQEAMQTGGVLMPAELGGLANLAQTTSDFLDRMDRNPNEREKVRAYREALKEFTNHIKALGQRAEEAMRAQGQGQPGGNGNEMAKEQAKVQAMLIQAQTKAKIAENSAASRTRQKEEQFQLGEQRKDQELQAQIERDNITSGHELMRERIKAIGEAGQKTE